MSAFVNDAALPPLPLPDLAGTCDELLEIVRPFAAPDEFARVAGAVDAFRTDGLPLHKALAAYRDGLGGNESWLRAFWDDSYLEARGRLPMEVNYVLELKPERWGDMPLASFVVSLCRFFRRLGAGDLPAETLRDKPLSMDSFRFMAYTRIACPGRDVLYRVPLTGPARVAVAAGGRWHIVTLSDAAGTMVPLAEVDRALAAIRDGAADGDVPPVGAMTAGNRDDAARVRAMLAADQRNRLALADIENCLFAVALDDGGGDDFGRALVAGDCANRWFDKSLQVIASRDGRVGVNFEHAGCDAGCWIYALDWVDKDIAAADRNGGSGAATVRPLAWHVDAATRGELARLEATHRDDARRLGCVFQLVTEVNRDTVKALGCGPDVFTQLAFQAAYYRLTREHAPAYEAVAVRGFYQGRTECARPASGPMLEAARLLAADTVDAAALRAALAAADAEHRRRLGRCQQGLGAERHLLGLSIMAGRQGGPDLAADPAVRAAVRNTLSTSSVTGPCVRFFGFGPVVADGLGIGYAMAKEGLQLTATSLPGSKATAERFVAEVRAVIALMASTLASA